MFRLVYDAGEMGNHNVLETGGESMITIFNRREVLMTDDMQKYEQVKSILDRNRIKYSVSCEGGARTVMNSGNGVPGPVGQNSSFISRYMIYVKKDDYDQAAASINDRYFRYYQ